MTATDMYEVEPDHTANADDRVVIYVFTDPMMGLSYESEPVLERLKEHFGESLEFRYVMAGLVRDVSDFMTLKERSMPPEEGIQAYNKRLAGIYLEEEPIGGLPMNMENFHLFDKEHRSSWPLNIAFEAVRILDKEKAEAFLYALRRATIVEGRQTTLTEELADIAEKTGADRKDFLACLLDGQAESVFRKDLYFVKIFQVHSLPSYLLCYSGKQILVSGIPDYEQFLMLIEQLAGPEIHYHV